MLEAGLLPGETGVAGAAQSIFLDQPFGIVALEELAGGGAHVVDGLVDAAMDDLLLEGSEEALKVRKKRSATPLVSGSRTKAKLGAIPQNLIWFWK